MQQREVDDFFAQLSREEDELYDELAACPVCEVTGIVNPSGVIAAKWRGQELWSLQLSFDAWRVGSESIRREPLTLQRRVTDEEKSKLQKVIDAETVIRVRARVAEENIFGTPQGKLEEFIGRHSTDDELNTHLAELQKPVTHTDDRFGTFKFDRRVRQYTAQVKWNGRTVSLDVKAKEPHEIDRALRVANALWDDQQMWHRRVVDYAVDQMLPQKNAHWIRDGESEVSPDDFKDRMTLLSISVDADGDLEFAHDDGDLFWDHLILIYGNLSDGLTHAEIFG